MDIFKYFPKKPLSEIGDGKNQKYFTESSFDSAVMAKRYLAIPYEPLYRVRIEPNINSDRLWEKFEDEREECKRRRIWASFGLHGGGWEMVTRRKFLKKELRRSTDAKLPKRGYSGAWSIDKELLSGGWVDEYSCFKKPTEHDSVDRLLKVFLQGYKPGEAEVSGWKVPDDFIGGVFYWRLGDFEYTISVLIKSFENIYNGVKFWGVFWKDDNNKSKRMVYKPIEIVIPGFPLLKKNELTNLSMSKWFEKILNERFTDIREALRWKGSLISRDALIESDEIQLP